MRQFVLPANWRGGRTCELTGQEARYLRSVLRLGPGDRFPGLDRAGRRYELEITEAASGKVRLSVSPLAQTIETDYMPDIRSDGSKGPEQDGEASASVSPDLASERDPLSSGIAGADIILVQALPRGSKMDLIVRQAAEAGVSSIVPLVTERSLKAESSSGSRRERWERIVKEAVQQSGSTRVPAITGTAGLDGLEQALGFPPAGGLKLFLHERPLASGGLHKYLTVPPVSIAVCVGPEGGFSEEETTILESRGWRPLHLGPGILRTETAGIFAIAAIRIVMLERSSWIPSE